MARLPLPVATGAALVVSDVLYHLRPDVRATAARNLERVLRARGDRIDPAVLRRVTRQSFHSYGRYWAEGAVLPSIPLDQVVRRIQVVEGREHLDAAMASGRGVVMALPHVGSWEWGGAYLAAIGYPMTSVAERVNPPELFQWFIDERRAMGLEIVPLDGDTGVLLRTLRSGGLVGLLCDRDIQGNGVEVELFGEPTTVPAGPATLALRTGAVLIAAVVYSGPGRDHTARVSAPIDTERQGRLRDDVQRVSQAVTTQLETFIAGAPEQWYVFQPNWSADRTGS